MNAMGFSAKPQSKRGSKFVKNGQILRKSSFFGPPQKKEERGHKDFLSSNTNLLLLRLRALNYL